MKFNPRSPLPISLLAALCAAMACQKTDNFDGLAPHVSEVAFPVFQTTLNVADLVPHVLSDTLQGDTLIIHDDHSMTLYYTGKVIEKRVLDIFKYEDTTLVVPLYDTLTLYDDSSLPDSLAIKKAIIASGTTQFGILKPYTEKTHVVWRVLEMTKNGVPFRQEFDVPANTYYRSPEVDLTGYELNSPNNSLTYIYEARNAAGQRIKFPDWLPGVLPGVAAYSIKIHYQYLEGYWGNQLFEPSTGRIAMDINKEQLNGELKVVDPRVTILVENSFGFPTRGIIRHLVFVGRDSSRRELQSTYIGPDGGVDYNYPKLSLGQVGQYIPTVFHFNKDNSNIVDIFNSQPVALEYDVAGESNPEKDNSIVGFLIDSSKLRFHLQVEMPLEGSIKRFEVDRTIPANFGGLGDIDKSKISDMELKLVTENGWPIGITAQVEFLNKAGKPLDSLFLDGPVQTMRGAPVNAQGITTGTTRTETFFPMTADRINRLKNATAVRIRGVLQTSDGGTVPVKLLSTQKTLVKMGMKVKIEN